MLLYQAVKWRDTSRVSLEALEFILKESSNDLTEEALCDLAELPDEVVEVTYGIDDCPYHSGLDCIYIKSMAQEVLSGRRRLEKGRQARSRLRLDECTGPRTAHSSHLQRRHLSNSAAVIFPHNHPSGDPAPRCEGVASISNESSHVASLLRQRISLAQIDCCVPRPEQSEPAVSHRRCESHRELSRDQPTLKARCLVSIARFNGNTCEDLHKIR